MSWLSKLKDGFSSTKSKISLGLKSLFSQSGDVDYDQIQEVLISADVGFSTSKFLTDILREKQISDYHSCISVLRSTILAILDPVVQEIRLSGNPHVILMCGVNGNGKTTTVGKLAAQYSKINKSVVLVAADTFRAAAVDQLRVWSERVGCRIVSSSHRSDPASVAYNGMEVAKEVSADVVIVDTAGRLHTQSNFMQELRKISMTLKKHGEDVPQETVLVLDATTGQNAINQVKSFKDIVNITGIILTKIDSTAKAGVIIGIAREYPDIKINALGFGEQINDLRSFKNQDFVDAILRSD